MAKKQLKKERTVESVESQIWKLEWVLKNTNPKNPYAINNKLKNLRVELQTLKNVNFLAR